MTVKYLIILIAVSLLPCSLVSGQSDSTKVDSTQIINNQTEAFLKRLLEESATKKQQTEANYEDLEIDELIVSSLITKMGNTFFDYFTGDFSWPEAEGDYIIVISEKPFRSNTTLVTITVNDLEVFQNVLQSKDTYLQELALYAQQITKMYIINYQQLILDLDGEDRSGSGIY